MSKKSKRKFKLNKINIGENKGLRSKTIRKKSGRKKRYISKPSRGRRK